MLSREDLFSIADAPPRLMPPSFPLTDGQSSVLRALDRICRQGEGPDGEYDAGASLADQLAAADERRAALAPAIVDAMAAQDALAEVGLELAVRVVDRKRYLVVFLRGPMARQARFEPEPAE